MTSSITVNMCHDVDLRKHAQDTSTCSECSSDSLSLHTGALTPSSPFPYHLVPFHFLSPSLLHHFTNI
uniref:Uncharacterized protein n=1 Tax=Leishmania guyanensis TaxID=5670 RepID=A0A1E1J6N3_LEIGU|nr:Hypothetical protein BN36_3467500 [Leishmania guyanensis]